MNIEREKNWRHRSEEKKSENTCEELVNERILLKNGH